MFASLFTQLLFIFAQLFAQSFEVSNLKKAQVEPWYLIDQSTKTLSAKQKSPVFLEVQSAVNIEMTSGASK